MERVAAEARLREEQARVELYLQTAQVILMAQNLDGIITMINPKGCEVLGYPHDDLIGKNWFDCCIPQDSRDQIKKIFFLCKNPRIKPVSEHENEIRRKDGAIRLIRWHNAQLFDAAGTVIGVLSSGEDITERRIAERELEESEQRFKAIFDNADDGILLADTVTKKFTRGNLRISQMLGYTPEELTTLSITDIHPAKDLPFVLEQFEKQLQGEIELAADLPVKRKDGSLFYADINSFPLVLEGKTYLAGFFRDVTARKKAEEKLHLTLEEYRELVFIVNHSPAVAFLWKAADGWPVEYVSENVGQFGYSPEEFYSGQVSFPAVVHAGDLARVGAEVAAYSAQEECTQFTQEYRIVSPGGRVFTVDDRTWIRRNEQGEITHYQGIVLDITERKAHETLLQHFRELVNHSRDAIFVIDKEGRFIDVNEAACQSLGYTRTELLGMGILDIVRIRPDEPPFDERIDTIREKGSATFEGRHTRKDGSEFPVEVSVNVEQSEKKDTMIAIARDISERKAMESALRQKDEMMIAQSRQAAMGDMIAMIAHQWRQPITVIAMAVNNVKLDIALGEPISSKALVKMADTITDQTGHLSKTIDDFRDFFRPNKEKEKALIAEVLEGVMQIIGKSLANNNITVTVDNQSTSRLLTYPNELLQVFLNILNNAKDVLKENTVEKPRITVTITESPEAVAALFCDNGGGIPDAAISRIGEPYFTTKSVSGTGLGLYMSKTILEQHLNGALSWENRDKGACFTVTLMKE
jgi:PAS domain S-box-containing protein